MDGGNDGGVGGSWARPRARVKRSFSTMAASHREDSSDSLFLPGNDDPHYDNEHMARRRRISRQSEAAGNADIAERYHGDGLDMRRPVFTASSTRRERQRSVSMGLEGEDVGGAAEAGPATAPPVIDLTDETALGSDDTLGRHDAAEEAGASERPLRGNTPYAPRGGQRLPRFGRDVIDVEEPEFHIPLANDNTSYRHLQPRALEDDEDDALIAADLPGANFLALPPRRSATGRVQYSTLRRPTRPPSPPLEMDDEDIEFVSERHVGRHGHQAADNPLFGLPAPAPHHARPRSVTPYPGGQSRHGAIDLTNDSDGDDDVQIVDERRVPGENLREPDFAGAGHRVRPGQPGGFNIGRVAALLRENVPGGRLAQRVHDYIAPRNDGFEFAGLDDEALMERRRRLERRLQEDRDARQHNRAAMRRAAVHRHHGVDVVPTVRARPDGTIPGLQRVRTHRELHHYEPPRARFPAPMAAMMDYAAVGFDLGIPRPHDDPPPPPKYNPPPPAEEGFTRNPGEDEVVVCPNCGDELAVGEGEVKQEIWVVKGCGHAYCGDCAQNRSKAKKSKKGKARAADAAAGDGPPTFKECVVDGCKKSASARSMIRVFFGS